MTRGLLALVAATACWLAAAFLLQLQIFSGPAQQSVNVRWTPGTGEGARRAFEAALGLEDGQEGEPGTWSYHLADRSRQAIRQLVAHPAVVDTAHIDRAAFRVELDAPTLPVALRRLLEAELAAPVALGLLLLGAVLAWVGRQELRCIGMMASRLPGVEVTLAVVLLCAGFWWFLDNGPGVDENVHYDQIVRFASGSRSLHPALTMVPGFHALMAALVWAVGVSETAVRVAVFAVSLATVAVFYLLARTQHPAQAGMRTLQFTLLPILFHQFFLIYTDVTSLLLVLLMMLLAVQRRDRAAGVAGLAACLVRQSAVVWVVFTLAWSFLRDYGWTWPPLRNVFTRYWTFVATGLLFVLFVALNGGQVAIGEDVDAHPLGAMYVTNLFFLLFWMSWLFLPLWVGYRRDLRSHIARWWPWVIVLLAVPVYWFGFVNSHPYNNDRADYFLPNAVLIAVSSAPLRRALFFVPVACALVCVTGTPLRRPWWLLLPFTVLSLMPEWLVVPRYYIVPMSLFLVAREPSTVWAERWQTAVCLVTGVAAYAVVERAWGWI